MDQRRAFVKATRRRVGVDDIAARNPKRLRAQLLIDGLRTGYVHELELNKLRGAAGETPRHVRAYYTLLTIPTK